MLYSATFVRSTELYKYTKICFIHLPTDFFFFATMTKALYESFGCSVSFPIFGIITHLNIVHSGGGAVTFPYYFNMHFSDDKSC